MGCMIESDILDKLENAFVCELGEANSHIFYQTVREMGEYRETFTNKAIEPLIQKLKNEYSKVIGDKVESLEVALRNAVKSKAKSKM